MKVEVRYFASIREALGLGEEVEVAEGLDIAGLRRMLAGRAGRHGDVLGPGRAVRSARNRTMAAESSTLADGDEIGFFPPVTGG